MPRRFEFHADLACERPTAWEIILDWRQWTNSSVLGSIEWTEGEPWTPGSSRVVEALIPFPNKHRQRIISVVPGEYLGVLSYGFGYTAHTALNVKPGYSTETAIEIVVSLEGVAVTFLGFAIEDFIRSYMKAYIDELKTRCESAAGGPAEKERSGRGALGDQA